MSDAPENANHRENVEVGVGSRILNRFNRWRAELNNNYDWESESAQLAIAETDDDGDPISLSASSVSRSLSWAEHQRQEVARMTGMRIVDVTDEFVERYNERKDKSHGPILHLTEAMRKTRKIQKRWPKRYLCGGLALYLYGVIKRDKFSDIDFVSFEENVVDNECVSLECSKPYKHCLFLSPDVEMGSVVEGIRLQKLDQIIYWKMRYNRPKDQKDLKEYLDKQFLKDDDFKL